MIEARPALNERAGPDCRGAERGEAEADERIPVNDARREAGKGELDAAAFRSSVTNVKLADGAHNAKSS